MSNSVRTIAFCLYFFSLTACSVITGWGEPSTVELKQVVVRLSADYLNNLIRGEEKKLEGMILWEEYVEAEGPAFGKPEYFKQVRFVSKSVQQSTPESHPLVNLDLIGVETNRDDSEAIVTYQKYGNPQSPHVSVRLAWVGRGWLVTGDNIIGPADLATRLR